MEFRLGDFDFFFVNRKETQSYQFNAQTLCAPVPKVSKIPMSQE